MNEKIKLGLWGSNGHQIHQKVENNNSVEIIAYGAFNEAHTSYIKEKHPNAKFCESYQDLLNTQGLELISLCSPKRCEQANDAIAALEKGISVYAEKPCATNEADLDKILSCAKTSSGVFHEMAGTIFDQPYWDMAKKVQEGLIGEVIQVCAQKSYPMHSRRPLNEDIDGGQIMQNGVHAMRFIEHTTNLQANTITATETGLGEHRPESDLKMAAALMGNLENGAVFSANINYLNQPGLGRWGNEVVKVFGSKGYIESIDSGNRVQIVLGDEAPHLLETKDSAPNFLDLVLSHVRGQNNFPFDLETELHPTRMVIKAKNSISN